MGALFDYLFRETKPAKQKSLEDLRNELSAKEAELEKAKKKLEQVEHKMNRLQNKIKTESKKQRDARTHTLCFKTGHLEYVFPVIKDSGIRSLSRRPDFFRLMI